MSSQQVDYSLLLPLAFPGAEWSLSNIFDYDTLVWGPSNATPKPSQEELLATFDSKKPQEAMRLLRLRRNEILQESDIYALPDFPHVNETAKQAWFAYRQALRDLTQTATPALTPSLQLDETSVTWPSKPN